MKKILKVCLGMLLPLCAAHALQAAPAYLAPRVEADSSAARPAGDSSAPVALHTVTNNRDRGPGSLRHAISNAAPGDTIRFSLRTPTIIFLESSLAIDKDLTIEGPGPGKLVVARSLRRAPSFRVIHVRSGDVNLSGLSIANGRALNADGVSDNLGGGILNRGTLTVSNCVIAFNHAPTEAGGIGYGAGIFSLGALTVVNSSITHNSATGAGGGIATFHVPNFTLERSTISYNYAEVQGGGINFQGLEGTIENSTISGNRTAEDGDGSALVHITFGNEASELDLSSVTIARNRGSAKAVVIAALPENLGNVTRLINTLAAANEGQNFFLDGNPTVVSLGHNLDSDGSSGFTDGANGDIVGSEDNEINARISSLGYHGGRTLTHALLAGSPAINAGACVDADGGAVTNDQRGFPRGTGAACDIGAFENQAPSVTCSTDTSLDCDETFFATVRDSDGDPLTVVWLVNGTPVQTNQNVSSRSFSSRKVKLQTGLAGGANNVVVRVTDSNSPPVECSSSVTVSGDDRAPHIKKLFAHPKVLWPADNKMVPVRVFVEAEDCGPVTCKIISVRSNQDVGSDVDWIITGDLRIELRAQQSGSSTRVYTITVECTDGSGNTARESTRVEVPKKRPSGHGHGHGNGHDDDDDNDDDDDEDEDEDDDDDGDKDRQGSRDRRNQPTHRPK